MATRKVVHAKSALPTRVKRSILLEEGSRRLRNCSPELEWEDKVVHLNRLSSEMKNSGHSESFRRTILQRVVSKYENSLSNHQEDKVNMYRTREERKKKRRQNRFSHKMTLGSERVDTPAPLPQEEDWPQA